MNYLGHAYLSQHDPLLITGNMIGDHVKGKIALAALPEGIRRGVELHRKIDSFCDQHPATKRAKICFRNEYRLYSGAILDTVYDHFLANDPSIFATQTDLLQFTVEVYTALESQSEWLPPAFAAYFQNMKQNNWLLNYRNLKGVERSLQGLTKRATYMPDSDAAYQIFITEFYLLNQSYFELIDDLSLYVKNELRP